METFAERLQRLIKAQDISANEFARRVGKTSAYLSLVLQGKRIVDGNLKTHDAALWARALGVTREELVGARDLVLQAPRLLTERELHERFGIRRYEEPRSAEGLRYSAGSGAGVVQGIDDTLPRKVKGSKYLWEAPVVGDCMLDEIKSGEVVIYNTRLALEIGRIAVALRDEEELLIKRLRLVGGCQVLRPNRGEDVPVDERIRFLGRGVAVQRPLE